jgi:hypothetical protein
MRNETDYGQRTDLYDGYADNEEARTKRDELQARLVSIYAAATRTLPQAYKDASTGLKEREELKFSDEEIDAFLSPQVSPSVCPPHLLWVAEARVFPISLLYNIRTLCDRKG